MAKITLNINRSDVSKADVDQLQNYFNGLPESRQRILIENYSSFASWLKDKSPRLYNNVYPYLRDIWNQIQNTLEEILCGLAIGAIATVTTPIVGIVEGVKEGFENGLEAGVKKGFKAMGDFLDDIFS